MFAKKHISVFALLFLFFLSSWKTVHASHIAGAEFTYRCTGFSGGMFNYELTLKLYRDCANANPGATFPDPASIHIFNSLTGATEFILEVSAPLSTPTLPIDNWAACSGAPNTLCIEEGIYQATFSLPPIPGGYDIGYALCCRNNIISNLAQPDCEGVTFLAHIPGSDVTNTCNSMPVFKYRPSLFLCRGMLYNFDHSAIDPDGDSLHYEISNPFTGVNTQNLGAGAGGGTGGCPGNPPPPQVNLGNPMGPGPYVNVLFAGGHSYQNPFGPGGFISIDPQTGYLQANPMNLGVYVVAISVKEYRNGRLLSENKRDFQFNVINCLQQGIEPQITPNLSGLNSVGDTVYVLAANPFCFDFEITDSPSVQKILVTPVSTIFGAGGGVSPPYASISVTGNNPVTATVCWTPSCDEIGKLFPIMLTARDSLDCPNYNIAHDTIWVRVMPSPSVPPSIWHDLNGNTTNGDTILVDVKENFCFDFSILDNQGTAQLAYNAWIQSITGDSLFNQFTVTTQLVGDTLKARLCWETYCNFDAVYRFILVGIDQNQCAPGNMAFDTVYLRVIPPLTFYPTTWKDLSGNLINGDTLFALAHTEFCFEFGVEDTSGMADSLLISVLPEEVDGSPFTGAYPETRNLIFSQDSLRAQICWLPTCSNVNKVYRFLMKGTQAHTCWILRDAWDTVYIKVGIEAAPPPFLSTDLSGNSLNGDTILVHDRIDFCFAFELSDTHNPTHVSLITEIQRLDGYPVSSPASQITYAIETPEKLGGTICWNMPCELSGGTFRFILIGQDTFDCGLFNFVIDTVYVRNIENIPLAPLGCAASVRLDNQTIDFRFQYSPPDDIAGYLLQRNESESSGFITIDSLLPDSNYVYSDVGSIDPTSIAYCYRLIPFDQCGNQGPASQNVCSILLNAASQGYNAELKWNAPTGWPLGVGGYEVFHSGYPDVNDFYRLSDNPENPRQYRHVQVPAPINCYYIHALEREPGCGVYSNSNVECITFPPKIFFPNAFTPNGDGLNDLFFTNSKFLKIYHLEVFDRWGKLVFETHDATEGWQAANMPEGAYVYKVEAEGFDNIKLQHHGTVTLIR